MESYFGCTARVNRSSALQQQRSNGKSAEIYGELLLFYLYTKKKPESKVSFNDQRCESNANKKKRRVCIAISSLRLTHYRRRSNHLYFYSTDQ